MAHQIESTDTVVFNNTYQRKAGDGSTGFEKGSEPWHGIGIPLPGLASYQDLNEAAPELFFEVGLDEVYTSDMQKIEGYKSTVRRDLSQPLAIVGDRYTVLQNSDAIKAIDQLTMDPNGPKYETVGTLRGGRTFWALARCPWLTNVKGDQIDNFILLRNSHDGSSALTLMLTPVRVVCHNTLSMALKNSAVKLNIRHTKSIGLRVENAQDALGIVKNKIEETGQYFQRLAEIKPTEEQAKAMIEKLWPSSKGETETTKVKNIRESVLALWDGGIGHDQKDIKGTAWTLYNAVTQYVDHSGTVRVTEGRTREESNFDSKILGAGAKLKSDALDLALALN